MSGARRAVLTSWAALGFLAAAIGTSAQGRQLVLLSPEEAAQLVLVPGDRLVAPLIRDAPSGPRIIVHHPPVVRTGEGSVIETDASTRFVIAFQPNRAPVDMESLEITARKGLFSVSLTPRLKPYIQGTMLEANSVSVPEGRFMIRIEIADRDGSRTQESYRLEVRRRTSSVPSGSQVAKGIFSFTTNARDSRTSR
jgi:hypothetical protein